MPWHRGWPWEARRRLHPEDLLKAKPTADARLEHDWLGRRTDAQEQKSSNIVPFSASKA
jgi:hypothetical protein